MTKQKMIYDALGNPIPQHFDEGSGFYVANTRGTGDATGIDFSKIKMIYDALGNDIPQYFDVVEGIFKPITSEGSSGGGVPGEHKHSIQDVEGLDERLTEVFTQVSNGKSLLETVIVGKGSTVAKVGEVPTFEELKNGINGISTGGGGDNCPLPGIPIGAMLTETVKQPIVQIEVLRNIELVEVTQ